MGRRPCQRYAIEVPVLKADDQYIGETKESRVDVSGDFGRAVFDPSTPTYVPGGSVECHLPFEGDPTLFSLAT